MIIGGGVVGCSILFHLAKFGWKDSVLLERSELTSGSSWHAAGQIHTISSDPNISRLQGYTINLYKEIEEISGQSVGMHSTGGFYLASNKDWYDYLKRERSKARYMGLDQEFISLEEVARLHPLIDPKHYIAALWDPLDGDIDPSGVTYAYAKAAKVHGASYHTHTLVIETNQRADGSWDVVTEKGTINAEHLVNAGGLWAREVGLLSGLHLPVQPMEHHYLITEAIPEIEAREERLPAGIDYEGNMYFRQEGKGMLLGTYEPVATPWSVSGTPQSFGHELLEPQLDHIAERLAIGFERLPALKKAGIKDLINGPFTFGPDGNPMIGPVPGMSNYWTAVGVMAGTIPKPGRISLSQMLSPKGKLAGDLTVGCLSEENFIIFGSGVAQEMHRRWFEKHLDEYQVSYSNESSRLHGLGISGPNARELLSRITRDDVSAHGLKFRDLRNTFVAGVPAILTRLSFSGELGYEIYVAPEYQLKLYESILEAGEDLGLRHYGARALMSLRLEKNWGVWTLDFRPDFTAAESGLDVFINWNKDFVGKQAALDERGRGPEKRLVSLTIDTDDIDVSNDEAILKEGECVGYVTSGGYAHTLQRSMALGYVPSELAKADTALEVEINGKMYAARVVDKPLYDPGGDKMRA